MGNRDKGHKTTLPIRPMALAGKIKKIPVSKIKSGKIAGISYPRAIVAYFDMLGFSEKRDDKDIEMCQLDFSSPLVLAALNYSEVRFNVFSDCAFIAAPLNKAAEMLSAIRFAFTQWTADGVLVRGGIAKGTYRENRSYTLTLAPNNFVGSLFAGSAVTAAVKLEGAGQAALLFTNKECAEFFSKHYKEPIFKSDGQYIIGWSSEDQVLYWFTGVSFLRLLRIMSIGEDISTLSIGAKLINNILYSFQATDSPVPEFVVLAILSSKAVTPDIKAKALSYLGIKDPNIYVRFQDAINKWLSDPRKLQLLEDLAYMDSSIPKQTPKS